MQSLAKLPTSIFMQIERERRRGGGGRGGEEVRGEEGGGAEGKGKEGWEGRRGRQKSTS